MTNISITYIDTSDPDYRDWQLDPDQPMLICIDCHKLVRRHSALQHRCHHCNIRKPAAAERRTRRNRNKKTNRQHKERCQKQSTGYVKPRTWIKHQEPVCAMCGQRRTISELDVDHVVPLWAGGVNGPENYQVLCKDCHEMKTLGEQLWLNARG